MNILITAPSLNPFQNVSGVAMVSQTIIQNNQQQKYFHYSLGRPDKSGSKLIWSVQLVRQLAMFPFALIKNKIDLVHQNLPFNPKGVMREYIINYWCRLMRVPVVMHVHGGIFLMNGTKNLFFKKLSNSLFNHSKRVIVLSEIEKESLKEKYNYHSAIVLSNSIDAAKYQITEKKLLAYKPTILFLGRIHESKGIDDITEAFYLLKKTIDFKFVLCGTGPMKDQFIAKCEQMLGADFEFRGIVTGESKLKIIKESDLFIMPSRYGEGLPIALLETMAAGVVPIVTDDASMKSVVKHNENGISVNKKDSQDLYEKIRLLLSNPKLYEKLSNNAANTIEKQYNLPNYILQLNKIYNSAID